MICFSLFIFNGYNADIPRRGGIRPFFVWWKKGYAQNYDYGESRAGLIRPRPGTSHRAACNIAS